MTPSTLQFTRDDTRASALAKADAWYQRMADQRVTDFALAIGQAEAPDEQKIAALDQARMTAVEGRAVPHIHRRRDRPSYRRSGAAEPRIVTSVLDRDRQYAWTTSVDRELWRFQLRTTASHRLVPTSIEAGGWNPQR
jgi:hypothetical protein